MYASGGLMLTTARYWLACLIFLFPFTTPLVTHEPSEGACDVPLVVTRFNSASRKVEMVKDLSAESFRITQLGDSPSRLEKVSLDAGPKRLALVLDVSGGVTQEEWKLETEMAASLVKNGRPDDRFLLTVAAANVNIEDFEASGAVVEWLNKLEHSRPLSKGPGEKLYDSILATAKRMEPPQFGDVIYLFGHVEDSGSTSDVGLLREILLKNRIRFYGLSFTDPLRGKLPPNFNPNKPLPASIVSSELEKISAATGYFVSFHSPDALKVRDQPALLKGFLVDVYAGIAEPYRLRIPTPGLKGQLELNIELTDAAKRGIRSIDVHYPHVIYSCDLPPSGAL
jgi:hypothetical protein